MADKIVVMHDGIVEQIGAPLELYDRPDNLFVAGFIGSPAMNFIKGRIEGGLQDLGGIDPARAAAPPASEGGRPSTASGPSISVRRRRRAGRGHRDRADRVGDADRGRISKQEMIVRLPRTHQGRPGETIRIAPDPLSCTSSTKPAS